MEAVLLLIGTILGFALNELATRLRENRTERKEARAVRTLLSLEIDQNIALLKEWWGEVTEADSPEEDPDHYRRVVANRLIELPLPSWSHKMWESQTLLLPVALKREEIMQVYDIHSGLDRLAAIRSALVAAQREQQEDWRSARGESGGASLLGLSLRFYHIAPQLWPECERIVNELLAKGNPLAGTSTSSAAG